MTTTDYLLRTVPVAASRVSASQRSQSDRSLPSRAAAAVNRCLSDSVTRIVMTAFRGTPPTGLPAIARLRVNKMT
jgi:hypothetical protein